MEDDKLNNFSKKLFENIEFERPSGDFTEKLMLKIEMAKSVKPAESKPIYKNRFILIFLFTFGIITLLGFLFPNQSADAAGDSISGKYKLPTIDPGIINKYLHIDMDFGLIVKLIIGSVIALIVIDLVSGSLIDKLIDSGAKKTNKA